MTKLTAEQWYADAACMVAADGVSFAAIGEALKVTMERPEPDRAQAFNTAIWAAIRLREITQRSDICRL